MRVLALPLLLASGAALAQPADSVRAGDLGAEVVVTASRLLDAARQTGRHVTVLTAADLRTSPGRSLGEVLRAAAGVDVTPRGAAGSQADFSVRGSTFNGVLMLVDGARFNDPMTGHFLSDFPIPLAEIARVEVLRGPAAAVYGPDALGGVIHVITHTGLASGEGVASGARGRTARGPVRGEARAMGGSHATWDGAVALRREGAWSAAAEGIVTDGEAVLDGSGAPIVASTGEVRTDAERLAGTAALARQLGAARLTARVAAETRSFGAYQFYTPFASDTAREGTTTGWLQAAVAGEAAETRWRVQASGRAHHDRYTYYPGLAPNSHATYRGGLTAEASREVRPGLTLGAGASGEARAIRSNNQGAHEDISGGVFALARWAPAPRLTLTASARLDADPAYGVEPTPALALAWQAAPALTLRASGGRAVRAPTYVERYFNTLSPRPGGNLGNPALRAERAWNAEAGADLYPGAGVAVRATGFWRRTADLIDFAQLAPEDEFFLAQNVLEAHAAGAEVHATLRRRVGADAHVSAEASYAYTDIALSGERPGAIYKYALGHAPHLAQARLALRARGWTLGVDGVHKVRLGDLPSVTVANARVAAALPLALGGVRLEAIGVVRNATDARYAEVFGAPMPGRTWHLGVRLAR